MYNAGNLARDPQALTARLVELRVQLAEHESEAERLRLERDRLIRQARGAGLTIREIGRLTGLTHQRIAQLGRE